MQKLLFLINPHAGHTEIRNGLLEILQIFSDAGFELCVYTTKGPKDLTEKIAACGQDYDVVVCAGGDGTFRPPGQDIPHRAGVQKDPSLRSG